MERIYILGNKETANFYKNRISNATYCEVPLLSLGNEVEINRFVSTMGIENANCVVFDMDTIKPELCVTIALHIRLSIELFHSVSLCPMVFVTEKANSLLHYKLGALSQLFITESVYVCEPSELALIIDTVKPLLQFRFHHDFLDRISLKHKETEGRHSLANQWGVSVLSRYVIGGIVGAIPVENDMKSLYFKFTLLKTLKPSDVISIIDNKQQKYLANKISIHAQGKKVLLIDDEAEKGWSDILSKMLIGANLEVISEKVASYDAFSLSAKNIIEALDYDLVFLDLRLNGVDEENTMSPLEFSGMKVLQKIKGLNKGVPVIMFTASNKAWNLKAMLDAGADGYYIKESPEYLLPIKTSEANAMDLKDNVVKCMKRSFLKDIYAQILIIKQHLSQNKKDEFDMISKQLDIAFNLVSRARYDDEYAFSYVALEQILEMFSKLYLFGEEPNYFIKETREECYDYKISDGLCVVSQTTDKNNYPQWKRISAIYYQLFGEKDQRFGADIQMLIDKRNKYIHNKNLFNDNKHKDIYTISSFRKLFEKINILLRLV